MVSHTSAAGRQVSAASTPTSPVCRVARSRQFDRRFDGRRRRGAARPGAATAEISCVSVTPAVRNSTTEAVRRQIPRLPVDPRGLVSTAGNGEVVAHIDDISESGCHADNTSNPPVGARCTPRFNAVAVPLPCTVRSSGADELHPPFALVGSVAPDPGTVAWPPAWPERTGAERRLASEQDCDAYIHQRDDSTPSVPMTMRQLPPGSLPLRTR